MYKSRPLKRLLDTWDRNGSTSGPTPWQIYDDDDDDEISTVKITLSLCTTRKHMKGLSYSSTHNLDTGWNEWSASRHGRLTVGKDPAGLLHGKLCGCLSRCGRFGEEINLFHFYRKSNYDYLHVQPVAWSVYGLRCCTSPHLHRASNIPTEILCVLFQYVLVRASIMDWNRPWPLLSSLHILTMDP